MEAVTKSGKIKIDYNEDDVTMQDASLMVYEMSRLIEELLNKDWEYEYKEVKKDDEE